MIFGNDSKIMTFASSSGSVRGKSIALLYCHSGDNYVTIRNKKTGLIENIKLEELYERYEKRK